MTPILLDTVVGIIIILSTVVSLFRGFVREALTIANLAGGSAASFYFGPMLKPSFVSWLKPAGEAAGETVKAAGDKAAAKAGYVFGMIPPDVAATFLAYTSVFFIVFIILSLAGMAISSTVKNMGLGPADKFLGMLFGAARGFLIVFLFYLPIGFFVKDQDKLPGWAAQSISVSVLNKSYHWFDDYLNDRTDEAAAGQEKEEPVDPDSIKGKLKKMEEKLNETGDKAKSEAEDLTNEAAPAAPDESKANEIMPEENTFRQ